MIISKSPIIPKSREFLLNGEKLTAPVYSFDTVVVGSGAAGLNCADLVATLSDRPSVAIVTEGINMGTSRNTGSDKQTYYKLTLSGDTPDSVGDMAKSLFDGGSTDGDLALCEAAGSTRAFMRLVMLGVPFPYNDYGEFAGYQTDHDTRTRATSCGPLTSKYMTEALEKSVRQKDIPIFDGYRVTKLLTRSGDAACGDTPRNEVTHSDAAHDSATARCTAACGDVSAHCTTAVGVVAVAPETAGVFNEYGLVVFAADNVVWATGGPSAIYAATVYPESQTCAHGVLLSAGAVAQNLTESQYGLASVKFRWNLSGTYQQVLPRYYSTAPDGSDEREFLSDYFPDITKRLTAVFRKGYQWPFDPAKLCIQTDQGISYGSSLVDIAVYNERRSGRRVYMDFRRNMSDAETSDGSLDFALLEDEAYTYLKNSGGLSGLPIERLAAMNSPAIELYRSHGIDLYTEPLEIDMCAQHNNGGFSVGTDYESANIANLYIVGEAAGVFGIHRPGGSALNSTQVGSLRAAEHIAYKRKCACNSDSGAGLNIQSELNAQSELTALPDDLGNLSKISDDGLDRDAILALRQTYAERMTACGAFMRDRDKIADAIDATKEELANFDGYAARDAYLCAELAINRDILVTQLAYLTAIAAYIDDGGRSRGSYLVTRGEPDLSAPTPIDREHFDKVGEIRLSGGEFVTSFRPVRPIPERENWFERVYNAYREKHGQ